jgi:hypothetical protein
MLAVLSFLIVILFSLIVVKIGAICLETTGLSREISQFQAQSAFSGVGFTTHESETLMNHSVRRTILKYLMLMGSAGLTSAIATLILTFMNIKGTFHFFGMETSSLVFTIFAIILGLAALYYSSKTKFFENVIRFLLKRPLHLMKSKMDLYDYELILGLSKGNTIGSFEVTKNHWMTNKNIKTLNLEKEGATLLGIFRRVHGSEEYISSPSSDFKIHFKDKVVLYCKKDVLENLAKREKGKQGDLERKAAEQIHKNLNVIKEIDEKKLAEAVKKPTKHKSSSPQNMKKENTESKEKQDEKESKKTQITTENKN